MEDTSKPKIWLYYYVYLNFPMYFWIHSIYILVFMMTIIVNLKFFKSWLEQ